MKELPHQDEIHDAISNLESLSHILETVLQELWRQEDPTREGSSCWIHLALTEEQRNSANFMATHIQKIAGKLERDWEDMLTALKRTSSAENSETEARS